MSYFTIIGIGYLFNLFCVIILSIRLVFNIDSEYISNKNDILNQRQRKLIDNTVNPFRAKDFVLFLPFGYGLQLCTFIFKFNENFRNAVYTELTEKDEHLTKLEKEYNERP